MFSLDFKVKVDRILFGTLAYILDHISLLIGKFLNRDHSITKENANNIVIAKYLGLGSIVRSQVIIQDIKNTFPDCKIYYLTSVKNKKIFDIIKDIDNVLTIDDSGIVSMALSTFKLVLQLLKIKVDAFIDLDVFYAIVVDGKKLPQKRVVFLSFDDGWRSNLQLLPVIEKYNVPITIFVSTASVCEGNYWWEYVLNLHGRDMVERMKMLPYDEFCEAVNGMKIRCTLDRSAVDETELQKLINHPLVSIQSHTVSHPILTNCPDAVLEYELSESKRFLEDKTKGDVIAFSYPNGDVGDREKNAVKKAGYKLAFTTQAHNIGLDTIDEFLIPRMAMNTWGGKYENFSKILGIWQKIIKNE